MRLLVSGSKPTNSVMDKLDEIFDLQDALNKRIGVNTDGMSDEEKAKWVLNYTRAMQQEIAELIDSVPWRNTKRLTSRTLRSKWWICFTF